MKNISKEIESCVEALVIACEICHRGPEQGVAVHRANAKGQPGIWRCDDHPCRESKESKAACQPLIDILERRGAGKDTP